MRIDIYSLAGMLLSDELVEILVMETREAQKWYDRFSDEEIIGALDMMALEPETAAQFLEDFCSGGE